ncbi:MAG TPA: rubrerythrin family protein [Candidatus Latescibacteria bacterium]|nr:rubrerythrin family protein [Candidatus Latescibacterota bacterium]
MRRMTGENLRTAFAGESQAHMRYIIFAQKAEEEGYPNIARLFRAISFAEQVHATNHFRTLGDLGSSADNLDAAIAGETFEVEEMYPAYGAVAELQGEKGAQRSINYALEAEKIHAAMYSRAKEAVKSGKDLEVGKIYICSVCGYTGEGEPPERCPICGATRDKFEIF